MGIAGQRSSRRALAYGVALVLLLGTIITFTLPAMANHPAGSCLDLEPEADTNPTGTSHTVTATLRTGTGGVEPSCPDGGTGNEVRPTADVIVDFEITGPSDPDSGNTPQNPDRTCTIPAGGHSCEMLYTGLAPGTDTIRGWLRGHTRDDDEPVDASGEQLPAPFGDEPDTTDAVSKTWQSGPGAVLDCEPENETNPTGTTHTVTCTARDNNGGLAPNTVVDAEATGANDPDEANASPPDFTCATNAQGQCSFNHGPGGDPQTSTTDTGTTTYRAWIDDDGQPDNVNEGDTTETASQNDSDDTDVVTKQWEPSPLECEPETDVNAAGTAHTVTCSARNPDTGQPTAGILIDVEATGANDPDGSETPASPDFICTTDAQGQCSFTHGPGGTGSTNAAGTTLYRAWIDQDGNHGASPTHGSFEGDAAEGRDEDAQQGQTPEPDRTDVVSKTWGASRVDCTPEVDDNPSGTAHAITCRASDQNNANVGGAQVDVEATGANDPDGSNSINTPDFTCTTAGNGNCTISHGPGGVGTTNSAGTTTYRAWIDVDDDNSTTSDVDTSETRLEGTSAGEPDNTDVVEKTWTASRLDCEPEADTNPAGTAHTINCTATDATNAPVTGTPVDAEATGPNDPDAANSPTSPDFSCTTGTNGQCSFTHGPGGRGTTNAFGKTLYRAWIDIDDNDATADADAAEGRDEAAPSATPSPTPSPTPTTTPAPGGPGVRAEPDETDVVEKNWSAVPDRITLEPESDTAPIGSCNVFTVTAVDPQGNPVSDVVVDVEQHHERSDNATANDEPTVSFCTPGATDGPNPTAIDESRGDLAPGTDGTNGGEAVRTTDADGKVTFGVRVSPGQGSNGTGTVLVTAFYENEDNDDPDPTDPQDTSTKTWEGSAARSINCAPETARNRTGRDHSVTCTVRDATGQPALGEGVTFTEDGPGQITSPAQANTNAEGRVQVTTTSDRRGTQTITATLTVANEGEPDTDECERAAGDPAGSPQGNCSDSVEKTWTRGKRVRSGPCKNFFTGTRTDRPGGGQVIVGTKGANVLVGTPGPDIICGLGGNDRIRGRGGNDVIVGQGGRDRLFGNGGNDRIRGGAKADVLKGGKGNDRLKGGPGDDTLEGGAGRDTLRGGGGDDALDGGRGRDSCAGGRGRDRLRRCE